MAGTWSRPGSHHVIAMNDGIFARSPWRPATEPAMLVGLPARDTRDAGAAPRAGCCGHCGKRCLLRAAPEPKIRRVSARKSPAEPEIRRVSARKSLPEPKIRRVSARKSPAEPETRRVSARKSPAEPEIRRVSSREPPAGLNTGRPELRNPAGMRPLHGVAEVERSGSPKPCGLDRLDSPGSQNIRRARDRPHARSPGCFVIRLTKPGRSCALPPGFAGGPAGAGARRRRSRPSLLPLAP
jgi:hypothetical protein